MADQKIAILTDSCADIPPEVAAAEKEIFILPLKIRCIDGEFSDGVDIFADDIYARLEADELPQTSLPSGEAVERILDEIAAEGYEKVIAIHLSGALSGTYNMVRLHAAERKDLEIKVFDSRNGSLGIGIMVYQTLLDIHSGMTWEQVLNRVERHIGNTVPFFTLDTLEYLQKGGRIGRITAFAGTMLNIKPIVRFAPDGQLKSIAKVRGRKQAMDRMIEMVVEAVRGHKHYNLGVANGGAPEEMKELGRRLREACPNYSRYWEGSLDGTLSVYVGKGVLGAGAQLLDD